MTLRTRVTLAAGSAVLLAVVAVSIAVYAVVRANLHEQIDQSLTHRGLGPQAFPHDVPATAADVPRHVPLVQDAFFQVVDRDGSIVAAFDERPLPVSAEVIAVARGERAEIFFDANVQMRRSSTPPKPSTMACRVPRGISRQTSRPRISTRRDAMPSSWTWPAMT